MSGGAGDIIPTNSERAMAARGVYIQLEATTDLVEKFGSVAAGIEACGMQDFIDNQINVVAAAHAWVHHMEGRIRHIELGTDIPKVPSIVKEFQ